MGLMWWMLAREVLRMRGTISREHPWEVMPDLYFYRDPEEVSYFYTFQCFRILLTFDGLILLSILILSLLRSSVVCVMC